MSYSETSATGLKVVGTTLEGAGDGSVEEAGDGDGVGSTVEGASDGDEVGATVERAGDGDEVGATVERAVTNYRLHYMHTVFYL